MLMNELNGLMSAFDMYHDLRRQANSNLIGPANAAGVNSRSAPAMALLQNLAFRARRSAEHRLGAGLGAKTNGPGYTEGNEENESPGDRGVASRPPAGRALPRHRINALNRSQQGEQRGRAVQSVSWRLLSLLPPFPPVHRSVATAMAVRRRCRDSGTDYSLFLFDRREI
jgi:hypothetical protein